eukprot:scaffold960_cov24-Tisochrysis_lutea.AAC.3
MGPPCDRDRDGRRHFRRLNRSTSRPLVRAAVQLTTPTLTATSNEMSMHVPQSPCATAEVANLMAAGRQLITYHSLCRRRRTSRAWARGRKEEEGEEGANETSPPCTPVTEALLELKEDL